jgi:hypothetical protein
MSAAGHTPAVGFLSRENAPVKPLFIGRGHCPAAPKHGNIRPHPALLQFEP